MNLDHALTLASGIIGVCWTALLVAPRARVTQRLLETDAVPLAVCVVYAVLVIPFMPGIFAQFDSLAHIDAMLNNRTLLLTSMLHFMAFDLMVGRAILTDAQRRGIPHWMMVPCLLMSLLLAPIGYVMYRAVRAGNGALRRAP